MKRHLDYLNLIYQTDIYELLHLWIPLICVVLLLEFLRGPSGPHACLILYIRQLPTILKQSMVVGYADDHSLLKIIPDKTDHVTAASDLNCDLAALYHFGGQSWQNKICS